MNAPTLYRVAYHNRLDDTRRVLIGNLLRVQADAVLAKWGNPKQPAFYMGIGTKIELCDGTPDGEVIK